jgi:hypothetical protein
MGCVIIVRLSARSSGEMRAKSSPSQRIRPEVGRRSPLMRRMSVDLPAPLEPMRTVLRPASTSSETASTNGRRRELKLAPRADRWRSNPKASAATHEQPEKEWRANRCCQNPNRHFRRRHNCAGEHIGAGKEVRSQSDAERQKRAMIGANNKSHRVRRDDADKADDAGGGVCMSAPPGWTSFGAGSRRPRGVLDVDAGRVGGDGPNSERRSDLPTKPAQVSKYLVVCI